ncbi:MAG: bifunctional diaminohydroxyphosphoribosylaminopyrimidine deaminase/5-amino-6-(5-phosphoribosylamino)uracil reductase RibD [Candidatus Neomarinimicrobiota bacterium]
MDTKISETVRSFMQEAILMAKTTSRRVSPNPRTGAVIVSDGKIIGRGRHEVFGEAHAEVNAINDVGTGVKGCDIYVTLEPCSHTGKTPPCADKIIASGIKRVFIGMRDPNPLVAGRGVEKLRQAGIEVVEDVLHEACLNLNQPFIKMMTLQTPYIIAKMALTLDGFIADKSGESKWISSHDARVIVHQMRADCDAVLIGLGTALKDDPELTVRDVRGEHPLRVVYDPEGMLPTHLNLVKHAKDIGTTVITGTQSTHQWRANMERLGVKLIIAKQPGNIGLREALNFLGQEGISSILCEGGGHMHTLLAELDMIDRVDCFIAPKLIGKGIRMMQIPEKPMRKAMKFIEHSWEKIDTDIYFKGILKSYGLDQSTQHKDGE